MFIVKSVVIRFTPHGTWRGGRRVMMIMTCDLCCVWRGVAKPCLIAEVLCGNLSLIWTDRITNWFSWDIKKVINSFDKRKIGSFLPSTSSKLYNKLCTLPSSSEKKEDGKNKNGYKFYKLIGRPLKNVEQDIKLLTWQGKRWARKWIHVRFYRMTRDHWQKNRRLVMK